MQLRSHVSAVKNKQIKNVCYYTLRKKATTMLSDFEGEQKICYKLNNNNANKEKGNRSKQSQRMGGGGRIG